MRSHRVPLSILVLLAVFASASAQSHKSVPGNRSPAGSGVTWAMQAMLALTGGNPVNSVTESGSVTRTLGGDQEPGSITLQSTGIMTSEMDISIAAGVRSEIRTFSGGYPDGVWVDLQGNRHPMSLHNCWTDAVWFFPALSLLVDYADPNLIFDDLGQEQYGGSSVEHIRVHRIAQGLSQNQARLLARLSTVHYYLDSQTAIPRALAFAAHADADQEINIPVGVIFFDYRSVNGILVPFQIAESLNGTSLLQITISSASPNNPVQGH